MALITLVGRLLVGCAMFLRPHKTSRYSSTRSSTSGVSGSVATQDQERSASAHSSTLALTTSAPGTRSSSGAWTVRNSSAS